MGFFTTTKTVRRLQERIEELSDTAVDLRRQMRTLKLEWEETYDKIHRLFGRIAKRQAIDHPPAGSVPSPDEPRSGAVDEISAKILARRAAGKH